MIYTMFSIDTKSSVQEEIRRVVQAYIKKHGKPPQIVEVNPDAKDVKVEGVPVLSFQHVQKGLIYLGEEQKSDESNSPA